MRRVLAKSLLLIFEAVIDEIAELIKKRGRRNGHPDGLNHLRDGGGSYGFRGQSTAQSVRVRVKQLARSARGRSISKG